MTERQTTGESPLIDIIKEVYNTKIRMKLVLETQSDDFEEYATIVTNNLVDEYNKGYRTGFIDGYHQLDPYGDIPDGIIDEGYHDHVEYERNIPSWTADSDIENLITMMQDSLRCRLLLKTALRTESDEFVTYPDIYATLIENEYDLGYSQGYTDGQNNFDISKKYFEVEVISGDHLYIATQGQNKSTEFQYKVNNQPWQTATPDASINYQYLLPVVAGDRIQFKRNCLTGVLSIIQKPVLTGSYTIPSVNVRGNIMSLYYGDDFVGKEDTSRIYKPSEIFYYWAEYGSDSLTYKNHLRDCSKLYLPQILSESCYAGMFQSATYMTYAPALNATTLAKSCYQAMFNKCQNLREAPVLPAMTMAENCYSHMFMNCTSLTSCPALPATTLAKYCYNTMFHACSGITTFPTLPATLLAEGCYGQMFSYCTRLTSISLEFTMPAKLSCNMMFRGCHNLQSAEILCESVWSDCYYNMFEGCTSLTYIKCLAGANQQTGTAYWVIALDDPSRIAPPRYGTFVKKSGVTWNYGVNGIPYSDWTIIDA